MDIACDTFAIIIGRRFPRYLQLMNGNMQDPEDSMLSPNFNLSTSIEKKH